MGIVELPLILINSLPIYKVVMHYFYKFDQSNNTSTFKLTCRLHWIILQNNIQNKLDHFKNVKDFILKLNKPNWKIGKLGVKIVFAEFISCHMLPKHWLKHASIHSNFMDFGKEKMWTFALRTFWNQLETVHFRKKAKSNNKRNKLKSSSCSKRVYRDKICR